MAGQVIRRGERKWMVRIFLGRDHDTGKRRYHNHTVNGSKKDAERYRTAALHSRDLGTFVEPARITLNTYLDRWLKDVAKPRVRPRTYHDYKWLLANYAKPGDRILDTHLGSGSIAIACHYAGHHLTGCEIDPDYFEAACERVERETRQLDFFSGVSL